MERQHALRLIVDLQNVPNMIRVDLNNSVTHLTLHQIETAFPQPVQSDSFVCQPTTPIVH